MTKKEFTEICNMIVYCYPNEGIHFPKMESIEIWYDNLKDLDFIITKKALENWIKTKPYSPTIADIRAQVAIDNNELPDWELAWHNVEKAANYYGADKVIEALESFDITTIKALAGAKYLDICDSLKKD